MHAPFRAMMRSPACLVVAALLVAAACAPTQPRPNPSAPAPSGGAQASGAPPSSQPGGVKRVTQVLGSEVVSISPYGDSASPTYALWMHIFEPLIAFNPTANQNEPLLALSWTTPSENTWEFKLRQDVKFHDGSPFTADDVVHSYKRMRDDPESKQRSTFSNVSEVEAVDRYTVRLTTKEPDAALIFRLNNRMITSKAQFDKAGSGEEADKQPMGTGPWLFKEYVAGQRVVMTANPNYWGADRRATFDEMVVRFMKEPQAAVTALLNNEVDLIANIPPQLTDRVATSSNAHLSSAPGTRLMFLGMNEAFKPWDNVKLRQAINYAIDKESIIQGVLNGRGSLLKTPIGPGMYAYEPNLQPQYTYDPARAKLLLAEAGFPNGLEVELQSPSGRYLKDKEISEAVVGMLGQIGIRARLVTPEWGKVWPDVQAGRSPFYLLGRGSVEDPSEYLEQYFRTGVTPRINFSDPQVDADLAAQKREFDPAKRVALIHKAMSRIMEMAPMVFLFQYEDTYGVSNRMDFQARGDEYVYAWDMKLK